MTVFLHFQSRCDTCTMSLPSPDLPPSSASCNRPAPFSPAEASPEQKTEGTAALWPPVTEGRNEVLLPQGWRPPHPPPPHPPTLMSLVRVCKSVVNSTLCSSSCCRFCTSLLSRSFSSLVSLTRLFNIWIWSCWSWISLRFSSILLEAA